MLLGPTKAQTDIGDQSEGATTSMLWARARMFAVLFNTIFSVHRAGLVSGLSS
jgi:hypothetical protein